MENVESVRVRDTARIVLLDEQDRALLFRYEEVVPLDPGQPELTIYWSTVGGGVEPGETFEKAAQRELWEETGLRAECWGPWLWTREVLLRFPDELILFHERYFLAHVREPQVVLEGLLPYERDVYRGHHWWTLAELRATSDPVKPDGFVDLLEHVLAGRLPATPITIW